MKWVIGTFEMNKVLYCKGMITERQFAERVKRTLDRYFLRHTCREYTPPLELEPGYFSGLDDDLI